jgi:hypothetical protein
MLPSDRSTRRTVNRRLLYVPGGADIFHKSGFLSWPRVFPLPTLTRYAKLNNQPNPISTIGLNSRNSHDCEIQLRPNVTEGALAKSERSRSNSSTAESYLEIEISTEINKLSIFFPSKRAELYKAGKRRFVRFHDEA